MQVGWPGLGARGAPMAARAARAGHVVRGCDVVPGVLRLWRQTACGRWIRWPPRLAARSQRDLFATPKQVEEALFAPGGAAGSPAFLLAVIRMSQGKRTTRRGPGA